MTEALLDNSCTQDHRDAVPADVADLFDRYREKLLRMISLRLDRRLGGKVDGEDLLQEVFVEIVRRHGEYVLQPAVPVFVWLRQIAGQIVIDAHRRYLGAKMRSVNKEVDIAWVGGDTDPDLLAAQLADSLTTPSQFAVRTEAAAAVRAAIDSLAPLDREVLVLRHLEELSNSEVAEVLGIDRFAASKRYLRALARLRSVMLAET